MFGGLIWVSVVFVMVVFLLIVLFVVFWVGNMILVFYWLNICLEYLFFYDLMIGFLNWFVFFDFFEIEFFEINGVILMFDIDKFKLINDMFGY